jgi:hypothetical protein
VENRSGPSYTRHTQKSQWVEIFLYRLNNWPYLLGEPIGDLPTRPTHLSTSERGNS